MKNIIVFRTGKLGTWREKFNGIAAYAKTANWRLQPVDARLVRPDFRRILKFWRPDGIIIDASGAPKMFSNADFGTIPTVVMNPEAALRGAERPSVTGDSSATAKLAVSELLGANPVSLVFIEWFDPDIGWSALKRDTTAEIAHMHGIPMTVITPKPKDADNIPALEERIAKALSGLPRPCGVFAVTDVIGATAVSAVLRLKARIPEDFTIISVDDDPEICENCSPTLTSIRPDFHRLGFSAGRLLQEAMDHSCRATKCIKVPPLGIVRRATTRIVGAYHKKVNEALELIRLNACKGISPGEVAALFGTSRRMAEIRFKATVGKSINAEIIDQRLSAACTYLSEDRMSISAIANFCGWKSDIAFRKAFKSRFGLSPLKWMQSKKRPGDKTGPDGH